jgi:Pyruvate/2-oxoacid:ferredoxin oxidoreductase gamma subunit
VGQVVVQPNRDFLQGPGDPVPGACDATRLEHLGRPLPGAPLLGGFAALTRQVSLESVAAAFTGPVAGGNMAAAEAAFAFAGAGQRAVTGCIDA